MSTIATTVPTCLGTLISLPPELRDQIYDHVLDNCYVVFWTWYRDDRYLSPYGDRPTVFSDLEIRLVSKTLSAEASARLFSAATVFKFSIGFSPGEEGSHPPSRKVTAEMRNVEFVVETGAAYEEDFIGIIENGWAFCELGTGADDIIPMVIASGEVKGRQTNYYPAIMDPRCEASVDHFMGSAIERDSLIIAFSDFDAYFHHFMATRFFQTLKLCVGFRTIAVELEWWDKLGMDVDAKAVKEKVEEVRMELEPCWGPCVVESGSYLHEKQSTTFNIKLYFTFRLEFQPLKFRGQDMKVAGAAVVKEADRLEA